MSLLASSSNANSSSRGHFYEVLMHSVMRSGGRMEYRFLDVPCDVPAPSGAGRPSAKRTAALQAAKRAEEEAPDAPLFLPLPPLPEQLFAASSQGSTASFEKAAGRSQNARYLRPDGPSHPIFDACIYPAMLLQFTVSESKEGVNEGLLERFLECLPPADRYFLDYVVPADVYPRFTAAPLKRDNKTTPRVCKTHVRVLKVEAAVHRVAHAKLPRLVAHTSGRRACLTAQRHWV
jgi:hypothetical protein